MSAPILPEDWDDWSQGEKEAFAKRLAYDWSLWARPEQMEPEGDEWAVWAYIAGRGSGKTRTGAEWVKKKALQFPGCRIAAIGPTSADVRETMFEGVSGLLAVLDPDDIQDYNKTAGKIVLKNGSEIRGFTGEKPDRLRGPQHHFAWVDELAAMPYADEVWDQMLFGLRLGKHPRVFLSTTPRSTPLLKGILKRDDTRISKGRTSDNVANLSERAVKDLFERYEGTWLGAQELDGELIDEAPGALWTLALIEESRSIREKWPLPDMLKVVVAIDPAVSDGPKSDSTGIAVVGLGSDRHIYVLADLSLKGTPDKWARVAIDAYNEWGADLILYEKNQGGNLIAQVLKQVDPFVPLRPITAVKDKAKRALPIVGLFEQKRAHIVGVMPKLEEEMTGWQPGISRHSPDRMDAMVHAASHLAPRQPGRLITPSQGVRRGRATPPSTRYPGSFPPRGGTRTWVAR